MLGAGCDLGRLVAAAVAPFGGDLGNFGGRLTRVGASPGAAGEAGSRGAGAMLAGARDALGALAVVCPRLRGWRPLARLCGGHLGRLRIRGRPWKNLNKP